MLLYREFTPVLRRRGRKEKVSSEHCTITRHYSVKDVRIFECVCVRLGVCTLLSLTELFSLWAKNNRLLYLWMVFYLVPWFNVPCLSASQKCCIYYMPQRLCNCITILLFSLFFFILYVPYCQCKLLSKLLWKWKLLLREIFCTFWTMIWICG